MIMGGLPNFLDWDNDELFCQPDDDVVGATAAVAGYPEQTNPYKFIDSEDGSVQQVAAIQLTTFLGVISSNSDDQLVFQNSNHQDGYQYSGLSGGVVVCSIGGRPKYLGIAVSRGGEGRRFAIVRFSDIRAAIGNLMDLPWQLLDEAYLLGHPTHAMMTFREFEDEIAGTAPFVQRRSNTYLEQLLRTMQAAGGRETSLLQAHHDSLRIRLGKELLQSLKELLALRIAAISMNAESSDTALAG